MHQMWLKFFLYLNVFLFLVAFCFMASEIVFPFLKAVVFFVFSTEVELNSNIVGQFQVDSMVAQLYLSVYLLFQILFQFRLLQSIE